jgi:hypothetical protein
MQVIGSDVGGCLHEGGDELVGWPLDLGTEIVGDAARVGLRQAQAKLARNEQHPCHEERGPHEQHRRDQAQLDGQRPPACLSTPPQLKRWCDEEHLHEREPFCESRQVLTEQALAFITHDT